MPVASDAREIIGAKDATGVGVADAIWTPVSDVFGANVAFGVGEGTTKSYPEAGCYVEAAGDGMVARGVD